MRIKTLLVNTAKNCPPLYRFLSNTYHALNPRFKPGNSGAPDAITRALEKFKSENPGVQADYYGFGVYRGYTLWHAQQTGKKLGLASMSYYGFDSFRGFPELRDIDKSNKEFFKGQFACPLEKVTSYLNRHQADWSTLHLIEGFYADVLNEDLRLRYPFKRAAVVLFDCDLYHSTREALEWMTPYLASGTLLLMDDWITYGPSPELGQPKALYEFLSRHPQFRTEDLGPYKNNGHVFRLLTS